MEDAPDVWDAVTGAGASPFGMYALNSMRLEKGYRAWKGDLSTDYSLLEGGLDRFVKLDKEQDFPGKAALLSEKQSGRKKGFVTMIMEPGNADAPYMSTIWHGDEVVGEVTSCGMGYRTGKCVALGMVKADLAVAGTNLEVEVYGERRKAVVQEDQPLWDPTNERLRA
jgi:dimethylglycine dehydrogenase